MYSSFEKLWLESMSVNQSDPERQSKLRNYSKFKNKLIFENYLDKTRPRGLMLTCEEFIFYLT